MKNPKNRRAAKPDPTPPPEDPGDPAAAEDAIEVIRDPAAGEAAKEVATQNLFDSFPSLARIMSVVVLMLGILGVGLLFYRVMAGFFVPLFLAALLVVIFRPVHEWILRRLRGKRRSSAVATTGLILTIVLMPILFLLSIAAGQLASALKQIDSGSLKQAIERGREQTSLAVPHPEYFRRLDEIVTDLQTESAAEIDTSDLLQAKDILGSLQNDDSFGEAVLAATRSESLDAVETLDRLIADVAAWQNARADQSAPLSYVEDLDAQEKLKRGAEAAAADIRIWMQKLLGGSMWGPLRLAANLSDEEIDGLIRSVREVLQPRFVQLTSRTGGFLFTLVVGILVMVISVYFFLIDGPAMMRTLMRLSPLDDSYERQLLLEFDRTSRAVVLASVLSALAQGVSAAVAYYFLDFGSVVLLFFVTTVMALVPFLGAASVWLPCAIWLGAVEREWGAAIFLAIYGTLVISSIDNVIKVFVLHGRSQLHPLLALLSVLGGVSVFGPIGILVGPMVVVFLQTLLEILNHELDPGTREAENPEASPGDSGMPAAS